MDYDPVDFWSGAPIDALTLNWNFVECFRHHHSSNWKLTDMASDLIVVLFLTTVLGELLSLPFSFVLKRNMERKSNDAITEMYVPLFNVRAKPSRIDFGSWTWRDRQPIVNRTGVRWRVHGRESGRICTQVPSRVKKIQLLKGRVRKVNGKRRSSGRGDNPPSQTPG